MSDGSRYHRDSLTCAHKRFALGSMLKVTNLKNGKSVVVKVTDRCGGRRIIDLSYAAAKEIGIIASGVAMVRVEKVKANKGVPYKDDDEDDMPELDFEVTEGIKESSPQWPNKPNKANAKKAKKRGKGRR